MDMWDPLFLDELAKHFTVTTFDYSGLGLSIGTPNYGKREMAKDVNDLVTALGFRNVVIGGWSLGGFAAMAFAALYPDKVTHVLAIGSAPPGLQGKPAEQLFFDTALKPSYSAENEYILFFEPNSALSRKRGDASIARIAAREVKDKVTPPEVFREPLFRATDPTSPFPDADGFYGNFYTSTKIPVLALSGDHDLVFPVEN
jgi:pimeloyl-ACP methyl ester carboxylesterase